MFDENAGADFSLASHGLMAISLSRLWAEPHLCHFHGLDRDGVAYGLLQHTALVTFYRGDDGHEQIMCGWPADQRRQLVLGARRHAGGIDFLTHDASENDGQEDLVRDSLIRRVGLLEIVRLAEKITADLGDPEADGAVESLRAIVTRLDEQLRAWPDSVRKARGLLEGRLPAHPLPGE
jgi:hypothetical protein